MTIFPGLVTPIATMTIIARVLSRGRWAVPTLQERRARAWMIFLTLNLDRIIHEFFR